MLWLLILHLISEKPLFFLLIDQLNVQISGTKVMRPIHLKETQALINGLKAVSDIVRDHRVDALVCVDAREKQR